MGSTIRPASYCGAFGFKPSVGGINRGGSFDGFSQSCTGVIAATLTDTWTMAREMSSRAGGDAGYIGLNGPMTLPTPNKPNTVAMLQTAGWETATEDAKQQLQSARNMFEEAGINVIDRSNNETVEITELAIANSNSLSRAINAWEGRWPLNTYARDMDINKLSESSRERLEQANAMNQDEYRDLLGQRDEARQTFSMLVDHCEACFTLSAPDAASEGLGWTGDPNFTVCTSLLGVPSVSMPLLETQGLPLGLQMIGFQNKDAEMFSAAGAVLPLFTE
ncbi:MAG: hypothetical protein CMM75_09770 [Rhodospirillaceae bacterium]|nr:hypothetical protein [Rhodospirillaceae bacterium]